LESVLEPPWLEWDITELFGYKRVASYKYNIDTSDVSQGYQFRLIFLSVIWMQELNAPFASLLMTPNWEVLLTLLRDKRPCRGI